MNIRDNAPTQIAFALVKEILDAQRMMLASQALDRWLDPLLSSKHLRMTLLPIARVARMVELICPKRKGQVNTCILI